MQHLLYLPHRIPFPPNKGDKVRSYHLLKYLSGRYRVHLGTFVDDPADWQHVEATKKFCGETYFARLDPKIAKLKSLRGFVTGEALSLPYYRDRGLQRWVNDLLARLPVAHVLVFSSSMAQYVLRSDVHRIADFVDVDSDKWRQYARSQPWPLSHVYRREAEKLFAFEREVTRRFDATVFVSKAEALLFKRLAPESADKIHYANNGVDFEYFSPERDYPNPYAPGERAIVFTGAMDYWPNVDAVEWFARNVFPEVRQRFPDIRFVIVGAKPARQVEKLAELPGVVVTGAVPDVRPYIAGSALAVAPLRLARGIQNKVLEAMAMGKAVVASPEAYAGIDARPGVELAMATTPAEYVAEISAILSGGRAAALGAAARERVMRDYSWSGNLSRVERLLKRLRLLKPGSFPSTRPPHRGRSRGMR